MYNIRQKIMKFETLEYTIYVLRIINLDVRNSNDSWSLIFIPRKVFFTLQMLFQALFAKLLAVKML